VANAAWQAALANAPPAVTAALAPLDQAAVTKGIAAAKTAFAADPAKRATRVWSQMTLEHLIPLVPQLLGGSADLTGSNGTKTKQHTSVNTGAFEGNYIHYGVREHGMAAMMNGLALHKPFVPYGGTFLVFSDYCRPSVRLSALMEQPVVYIFSHDSIGVGEDGPTHQPVEHLASLRAMPNLNVLRPADAIETAECWEIALQATATPSVLALTRDAVVRARTAEDSKLNLSARGAYVVSGAPAKRDVTLIATGSEVGLAIEAAAALLRDGIHAAVVSMPSFEHFRKQDAAYRDSVLGSAPRIAIEAGVGSCWHEWLRPTDTFIGMTGFGASAPAQQLYEHFGITTAAIVSAATNVRKLA
jgi:transketolase